MVREIEIVDARVGELSVSAIMKPGAGILYNRRSVTYTITASTHNVTQPSWANYAYIFVVSGGGGGGAGSGTLPTRGTGGGAGRIGQSGYFLDGALKGETFRVEVGAGGLGGNSSEANGGLGGATRVSVGSYTTSANGGTGGLGASTSRSADGETFRYPPPEINSLRANLTPILNSEGVLQPGSGGTYRDSNAGGNGTRASGGGGGGGGIFNRWRAGGNGGPGFARIVFWGMDPYVNPNSNPHANPPR